MLGYHRIRHTTNPFTGEVLVPVREVLLYLNELKRNNDGNPDMKDANTTLDFLIEEFKRLDS